MKSIARSLKLNTPVSVLSISLMFIITGLFGLPKVWAQMRLSDAKIAFASQRDGNWEIYAMNADGTNSIRLTQHSADDMYPSWSPDGRKIAFASMRDGNWEIYVINANGTNLTNLTKHPSYDTNPSWSPRGTKIAFS